LAWPLTGRSEEMRLIEAALSDPDSSGIVICGAAGVGKSRIVREALLAAESKGCEVRWVVGTSSARALPLGALASWAGPAGGDSLQLVRKVIESLTSASPGTTVMVAVDDVHLLDDLSTFVVHQIVQRGAAKVVLTFRDGEPIPAATPELWKAGQFDRLNLQPLSQDETTALVSAALGGPLDPDAAQRLWKLTHGNALYLRNILEQEVADGRLAEQNAVWRWIADPIVPPGLAEMIESRIGALPSSVSDVIDVLAIGEPIELGSLTRITEPAAVEAADMRGLITLEPVDGGEEVRLAHPLYGEVRRKRAAPTRLRRLRGLVASELAASEDPNDIRCVVRRAALSLDSDLKPDSRLLISAAQGAIFLADLSLADRLTEAALRAGGGAEASFVRAHTLSWLSRGEEADAILADIDTSGLPDADRAALAFARAANRFYALSDPAGAKKLIDVASAVTPPQARSCIDAFLAMYWSSIGRPEAARQSSVAFALDQLPDIVGAGPAMALTTACGDAGRTAEAAAAAESGYAVVARSLDAANMQSGVANAHVRALWQAGRIAEANDAAERLRRQAVDLPGAAQVVSAAVSGRAAFGAGNLRTASSLMAPLIEMLTASGDANGIDYHYHPSHTIALAMRGLTDEALAALAALEKRRHPGWQCLDYERSLAHAWVAACQGAISEAITTALSAAETARAYGQFAAEVMCLQTATQFGDGSSAPRLRELEAIVEGPRVALAAQFATALHGGDGAELATVSEEFERMGDLVAAVDAAAHAALAYRRKDLRGSALKCSTRADALAQQCGGAATPAQRQASERLPLTSREREIVTLLGQGLSSAAISQRLTLSTRTIEGHIYRAMTKTGTTTRGELAALVPQRKP
jgi:DNA-binding CsgD family transcriptional regulator